MVSTIFFLLLSFILGWTTYCSYCLLLNYLSARKIGIPIRIIPISQENALWMMVDTVVLRLFEHYPFGSGSFTRYNWRGWEFADKCTSHLELGDVFILVTPGRNSLCVCNADCLVDIFQRRVDFPRPLELFGTLFVLGII
ncbi:cytochrome P450 protein [Rutstroemia sp. NJR-2017a WRK4]|nr:cytochrome P450 protein [Rutstroemia sp. NJR-2017a WRK4]